MHARQFETGAAITCTQALAWHIAAQQSLSCMHVKHHSKAQLSTQQG